MKLTPPRMATFWISVVCGVLGLLGMLGVVGMLAAYSGWLMLAAWVILVLGLLVKGL